MSIFSRLKNSKSSKRDDHIDSNKELERLRPELKQKDDEFNRQLKSMQDASARYKEDKDVHTVIAVYENTLKECEWNAFNYWMNLADYYQKAGLNNKAWGTYNKLVLDYPAELHRIRKAQFKQLRNEGRYIYALEMLANSHLNKNIIDKEKYVKDAKGTAKKAGLSEEELEKLAIKIESINSKLVPIMNDQKIDYKEKNLRVASLEKDVHQIFEER